MVCIGAAAPIIAIIASEPEPRDPHHHLFPQEFRKDCEDRGIDIDQWTMPLPKPEHQRIHNQPWQWNDDWGAFFNDHDDPTIQDAFDQLHDMIDN